MKKNDDKKEVNPYDDVLSSEEAKEAGQMSGALGIDEKPYQQISIETFTTAVIVSAMLLVLIYGILLPVPNPASSINSTALNKTVGTVTGTSNSNDLIQDISNISLNHYSGPLARIIFIRGIFSILMIICFFFSYRYVKKASKKSFLIYVFIFTSMVATSGPLGIIAIVLGGGGIIGGAVGGLIGAFFAFWTLQDRGFIA